MSIQDIPIYLTETEGTVIFGKIAADQSKESVATHSQNLKGNVIDGWFGGVYFRDKATDSEKDVRDKAEDSLVTRDEHRIDANKGRS